MTFDHYQTESAKTLVNGDDEGQVLIRSVLGLVGESGEVAEKLKKILRDHAGKITDDDKQAIAHELGDVLWYLARLADLSGYSLAQVADMNLEKLSSRKARNQIGGSGDNR